MCAIISWLTGRAWGDILMGAVIGLPIGFFCSFYSGLIVARWARFESLKGEVKRFILAVDWMCDGPVVRYTLHKPMVELLWTTSDLLFLQHKGAAERALSIQKDILDASGPPHGVQMSFEEAQARNMRWQQMCREMEPSWRVVLSLKLRL